MHSEIFSRFRNQDCKERGCFNLVLCYAASFYVQNLMLSMSKILCLSNVGLIEEMMDLSHIVPVDKNTAD